MTDSGSCCRSATWVVIASEYVRHRHMTTAGRTVTHRFWAILLTLLGRTEERRKKPQSEGPDKTLGYYKLNEWVYCGIQLDRKRFGWRQQWIIWWFCW